MGVSKLKYIENMTPRAEIFNQGNKRSNPKQEEPAAEKTYQPLYTEQPTAARGTSGAYCHHHTRTVCGPHRPAVYPCQQACPTETKPSK